MSPYHIDAKNAITTFRGIYSSVGSVESWLVIDARETDSEELVRLYYKAETTKHFFFDHHRRASHETKLSFFAKCQKIER